MQASSKSDSDFTRQSRSWKFWLSLPQTSKVSTSWPLNTLTLMLTSISTQVCWSKGKVISKTISIVKWYCFLIQKHNIIWTTFIHSIAVGRRSSDGCLDVPKRSEDNEDKSIQRVAKFKTKTIQENINPVWNETFTFDVLDINFSDLFNKTWIEFIVK